MRRVVLPPEAFQAGGIICIRGSAYRHLIRALRLRPGDLLSASDGRGREYLARLVTVGAGEARARVVAEREPLPEPPVEVTLLPALSKGDKIDLVIQKATELGVRRVAPVVARRSVARLSPERRAERRRHWQAVAAAAAEQCGRSVAPVVEEIVDLEEALERLVPGTRVLMPWEGERKTSLREALAGTNGEGPRRVALLVGPEGGWEPGEVNAAVSRGAITVTLGPRILRCETAALVAVALVLYEWGDLGAVREELPS
ncbi:MAG: 16S rRNA (uracil(1498)-N(3))-methyltransferase [Clostridia bacterium]|jgi:16S rRNA (uracil1498-N3)-methyltransferase|nr:16S rRNA (uracil(1498)-N(3))-methyltransferase [Clostridia bacterium]MDH7573636.1 16S rRNA (uracil(1498)-N(3))-methyltransferase [Clostridia bacterium]